MKFPAAFVYVSLVLLLTHKAFSEELEVEEYKLDPKLFKQLKDEVYQRVLTPGDDALKAEVKAKLVNYLVQTSVSDYLETNRAARQDEDGEAGQEQVYNGVRRILQNVFSGNLVGVIQESVSIRSPTAVQNFFSDVMGALFGSAAVKGAGTFGLPPPQNTTQNATLQGVPGAVPGGVNQFNGAQLPVAGNVGQVGGTNNAAFTATNTPAFPASNTNGFSSNVNRNPNNNNGDSEDDDEGNDDFWKE